jgi:hypothetical protein
MLQTERFYVSAKFLVYRQLVQIEIFELVQCFLQLGLGMVNWWQSVLYGRRFSDRNIEKLEQLESEIQQIEQQVQYFLENIGTVSRNCTKGQVLLSCLSAFFLFLTVGYSGIVLFKSTLWIFIALLVLVYLFRRAYVALIWYNIRRCRLKLAKLKTRKVHLLEELKQKNDFYKVFDVLKRFDENYKNLQERTDTRHDKRVEEDRTSTSKGQQTESPKHASVTHTPEGGPLSVSTEISRSSSSQDASNIAIEQYLGSSLKENNIQESSSKKGKTLSFHGSGTSSNQTLLHSWLSSIANWIVFGLSGEHNLQLEEQLEMLRESLELERAKRRKLEEELRKIVTRRKLVDTEEAPDETVRRKISDTERS